MKLTFFSDKICAKIAVYSNVARGSAYKIAKAKGVSLILFALLSTQIAEASALLPPVASSVNSPEAPGFVVRGAFMDIDGNHHGASDQIGEALRLYPSSDLRERALLARALNAMTIPGGDALRLLDEFIVEYPASAWRSTALQAVADVWFDCGEYATALEAYNRVGRNALNDTEADDMLYHIAYCRLKLMDYNGARADYARLLHSKEYANESRFYQGYIAYATGDYAEAAKLFSSVVHKGMPTIMASYYLAQINYAQGNYREAASNAKTLLSYHGGRIPQQFTAEMNRIEGESLFSLGDKVGAIPYLRAYVESTDTPLPSALYLLGIDDFETGSYEQAIQRLTSVSADQTAMGQSAFLYIGQSYLRLGNFNAASMAFDKAARMDGDKEVQEAAFYNLAVAKMQGGKVPFGSTVVQLEEFLRRYPNSVYAPEVADYIVSGYMSDNNYQAALQAINRIQVPPRRVMAAKQKVLYTLGARELQAGRASQAATYLGEAASMTSYDPATAADALLWLGEARFKEGNYKEAVEAYNKYLSQDYGSAANRALAYYDLGYARMAMKDFADAKADFSKFIQRASATTNTPLMADAYNRMADSQYYLSDFAGAYSTYSRAYQSNPRAGDYPKYQKAIMKGLQRDHHAKISELASMMHEFPSSALIPSALLETGESYGELADNTAAINTYAELSSRFPNTAQGRQGELLLAITHLNEGNRNEAISHYKKVITNYPTSAEARVAADDLKQLYAETGNVGQYVAFINSVPDAPKPEIAELSRLTLLSAENAFEANKLPEALAAATEVVEKYPDSPQAPEAWAIKAQAEMGLNRTSDALASYSELEKRGASAADITTARMGILRLSRDLGDNDRAITMADRLLETTSLGEGGKREVLYLKALSLCEAGCRQQATEIYETLAEDIDDIYGTKSQLNIAQMLADSGKSDKALEAVNKLIDANPPHDYWLARAFILLSDLLRKQGNTFEADEYLRSLRENYPGNEADIFQMIDERLK